MSVSIEQVEHNGVLDGPGVQRELRKIARLFPLTKQHLANAITNALTPAGTILATGRGSAATGFLLCDGATVSRTTYADLFTAIGTTYGAGDGSTTFGLPDLRGRVPVGVDGAAGRLSASDALGNAGGAETHVLTVAQMPSHNHGGATGAPSGYPNQNVYSAGGATNFTVHTWAGNFIGADANKYNDLAHTHSISSQGGGSAHPNMQPYQVVNWMVKT